MDPTRAAVLAGVALLLVPAGAAPASALSCTGPGSDWAQFRLLDVDDSETYARIPYTGHVHGYGCGPGNRHALQGDWFAWLSHGARQLDILDLATGERATFPAPSGSVDTLSVDAPHVFTLSRVGNRTWRATWHHVDPGAGADGNVSNGSRRVTADGAALHGSVLHLLSTGAEPAEVSTYDLADGIYLDRDRPVPATNGTPWRLLAGNGHWVVLRSEAGPGADPDEPDRLASHRIGTGCAVRIAPIGSGSDEDRSRFGDGFEFDGPTLYNQAWIWNLPWDPAEVVSRPLPNGTPREVDVNGSLMNGTVVDDGRIVVGSYLDEAPDDSSPWIADDQPPAVGPADPACPSADPPESGGPPSPLPAAGAVGSVVALTLALAVVRIRDRSPDP